MLEWYWVLAIFVAGIAAGIMYANYSLKHYLYQFKKETIHKDAVNVDNVKGLATFLSETILAYVKINKLIKDDKEKIINIGRDIQLVYDTKPSMFYADDDNNDKDWEVSVKLLMNFDKDFVNQETTKYEEVASWDFTYNDFEITKINNLTHTNNFTIDKVKDIINYFIEEGIIVK